MKIIDYLASHLVLAAVLMLQVSCTQHIKDAELKADITVKAKADVNFAGVRFTVENRIVTIWGNCPTPRSKETVLQQLGTIHMLEGIVNHLRIAPVTLGSSFTLKQQVDSVLSAYPTITAAVSDTVVILEGKIKNKDLERLLPSVVQLHSNVTTNRLKREI
jgi:hypothetical protein